MNMILKLKLKLILKLNINTNMILNMILTEYLNLILILNENSITNKKTNLNWKSPKSPKACRRQVALLVNMNMIPKLN